ncbi:MAG: 4-hydroxybenzoate octaprenyltransferase [Sphingopyxis sp.]|nr:4-hydroxybenzoate octaprenyltransferase [Sphingopyxis sp.]
MTRPASSPSVGQPLAPPDSQHGWMLRLLPSRARPFALLARFDRPIGWWLLFWPCLWGIALAGQAVAQWPLVAAFLIGAIAMRGAGCVYNDIIDRDLDRQVARTATRPVASGAVSLRAAWLWLCGLCLIGLGVLLMLPLMAQVIALASLALVAVYPFMKRISWWPQAWLGLVFAWGVPVGWAAALPAVWMPGLLLYAGTVLWVIGYDTIYALQDVEDDALVGIRSSARRLGRHVRSGVTLFYGGAILLWAAALWHVRPDPLVLAALAPAALHLGWQVATLRAEDGGHALHRFRANRTTGFLVALAMIAVGTSA